MTSLAADAAAGSEPGMRRDLTAATLFALAYFAGGELGYALSLGPTVGGTFWPPAGISLAVFLTAPTRRWPSLMIAALLANYTSDLLHGQTLPAAVGFALANLTEPLLGAVLIRRLVSFPVTFGSLSEMAVLAVVVVCVSAPVGAAIGAVSAHFFTTMPPAFFDGWRTWWVGDAVGALVLTPLVLRLLTGWRRLSSVTARTWLEAAALIAILSLVTELIFSGPPTSTAMPFLVFPLLLWTSVRLGVIGVGSALCLVVGLTTHSTAAGLGPFAAANVSLGDRLIALQTYVGVMALSFHALAMLWEERARTASALRLAHSGLSARYRRIVEQAPLAILAVRPDGQVQDVNPAWRRLWTASAGGVDTLRDPTHSTNDQLAPYLARAFTGEVVELPERELAIGDEPAATTRRVRGFAYPVKDDAGDVAEVVVIDRDITDEFNAQQQLVDANRTLREREEALSAALAQMAEAQAHRQRLLEAERTARNESERASLVKDEFLATLSHELRTPLHAILGWSQILRGRTSDPTIAQAVDTIDRNARTQARLIDDLLDMSRIMAGKLRVTLAPTRLRDVVVSAAESLYPLAQRKGVSLTLSMDERNDVWVSCDAARLQQVAANLISNGIKFTPAGGGVSAQIEAKGREARLIVSDTGHGIRADFLGTVFDRFRQADGSITRQHGGLGLGLSIAKQIVELHGGSIRAASDGPGRGAVFTVVLPLVDAPAGMSAIPTPEPPSEAISLVGVQALVVDDHADARELLRRLLVESGCDVVTAGSAEAALETLDGGSFDVLLTDIGMPGTDGYELLRRIRSGTYARICAIAVTAFTRPEDRDRAFAGGFDGYLTKPINPTLLLQMVAALVGRSPEPLVDSPPALG